jgi:septal ring factor EnvC (AmiA/AmiB activator)
MNFIKQRWEEYKKLHWTLKILAAIPLVILIAIVFGLFVAPKIIATKAIETHNKETTKEIKQILKEVETEEDKREEIIKEIKIIDKEINNIHQNKKEVEKEYEEFKKNLGDNDKSIDDLWDVVERSR